MKSTTPINTGPQSAIFVLVFYSRTEIGACGEALEREIRMEGEGARGGMGPKLALTRIKDVCAHKGVL